MARAKKQVLVEIYDDLDPKSVVAWYDQSTNITYGDADGSTPAEPYDFFPVRDPETREWKMKELWTTEANHKKVFGPLADRLQDADDAGEWVILEKSEVDNLKARIEELEDENSDLRKRPASGGGKTRRAYGTGPKRNDTAHIRAWLHANGFEVSVRGRIPKDDLAKFNEATGGNYEPTDAVWKAWEAFKGDADDSDDTSNGEELPFEGEHGSESEREALAKVRAVAGAPEAEEEPEGTEESAEELDDTRRNVLREAKEKVLANRPLTEAQIQKADKLIAEKLAAV